MPLISTLLLISVNLYAQEDNAEIDSQQADTAASDNHTDNESEARPAANDTSLQSSSVAASDTGSDEDDVFSDGSQQSNQVFSGNTGVAKKNIPIMLPQGRKGIEPSVSLNYNSNSQNGWLGIGWTLDMGAIQRETRWGLNYTGPLSNQYNFVKNNLLSRLVPRGDWGANYYGAKIESEFTKYYYDSTSGGWVVTAKDGTKYYYGSASASRQADPADATRIFKWCLDKVQDTNGNYMTITYWKDSGNNEIYLDEINYTGNAGFQPYNKVKFIRDDGSRADAPVMYTTQFTVKTIYRLKTIEVYSGSTPVRKYELSYMPSGATSRSLLSEVQEFGSDGLTALPKIINTYYIENDGSFSGFSRYSQAYGSIGYPKQISFM